VLFPVFKKNDALNLVTLVEISYLYEPFSLHGCFEAITILF